MNVSKCNTCGKTMFTALPCETCLACSQLPKPTAAAEARGGERMERPIECPWCHKPVQTWTHIERCMAASGQTQTLPAPQPTQQAAQGRGEEKPYVLIETSEDGEEDRMVFATEAERDRATLECIWFGGPDESDKEEAEAYLAELREKGILRFEGDPPLRWETLAAPSPSASRYCRHCGAPDSIVTGPVPSVEHTCTCGDIFTSAEGLADHRRMVHDDAPSVESALTEEAQRKEGEG